MTRETKEELPMVKIAFRDDDGETLWALDLGSNRYRLDNTPWYQYGVSAGDIVEAFAEPDMTLQELGGTSLRLTERL